MRSLSDDWLARARDLHRRSTVIDTHCDTTQRLLDPDWDWTARHNDGHVDLPRVKEGGIDALFFAVWAQVSRDVPGSAAAAAKTQIHLLHEMARRWPGSLILARTSDEVRRAKQSGRVAMLMGIEGGHLIEDSMELLCEYHGGGASYLTLTHAAHTNWADSAGVHESLAPRHGGLTGFGREVVRELNRLGMMVDVSHVSDDTFWDVLETSAAPVIATHSSCRAVAPHRRNLSDEMMRALAECGGTVQINFAAAFLDPRHPPMDPEALRKWFAEGLPTRNKVTKHVTPFQVLVDHFDHALQMVGPDHVGIGSDFDGVPSLPAGMEDCSRLPYLTAALLERGYGETDLIKVLGENVLRVLAACQAHNAAVEGLGPHPADPFPLMGEGGERITSIAS